MSATVSIPSISVLQKWASDALAARANLPELFACLSIDSEAADWATEALENCGTPESERLDWLLANLHSESSDVAYWSCKLIGRMSPWDERVQNALSELLARPNVAPVVKQQAISALGQTKELSPETKSILNRLVASNEFNLASHAKAALEGSR